MRSAHIPISHAHIQYGRLTTYYWYNYKTSHIPEFPINRKREIQYVMSVLTERRCKITTFFWNMQINLNFSLQKRNFRSLSGTKSTRRIGYTRIEAERAGRLGGYTRMTFGTIDDVTDAKANLPGRRERAAKRDK